MATFEKENRINRFCFDEIEISHRDITTVGKALNSCNPKDLLSVLLDTELRWQFGSDMLNSRSGATLIHRISSVLDVMNALYTQNIDSEGKENEYDPRSSLMEEKSYDSELLFCRDSIVVPHERFEALDGSGFLHRRVSAALINLGEAFGAYDEKFHHLKRVCSIKQVKKEKEKLGADSFNSTWGWKALMQSLKPLRSESWPNILNLRIWLPSFLSHYERYCILGSVFWAMTFWGFSEDSNQFCQVDRNSVEPSDYDGEKNSSKGNDDSSAPVFFCSDEQFYDELFEEDKELVQRMKDLVELLNYNCWVNFIDSAFTLSELGTAA